MSYAPLHLRSNASGILSDPDAPLLRGASSAEAIVAKAARLGLPAVALTDEGNLCNAASFFRLARAAGVKPILGATITTKDEAAVLLVANDSGYANLCEIISRRNLEDSFSFSGILPKLQEGLFVLTENIGLAEKLAGKLDRGRFFLELVRPGRSASHQGNILEAAKRLELGVVASCDPFFAEPEDYEIYEVLCAIGGNRLLENIGAETVAKKEAYLRSWQEMRELFRDFPQALTNTLKIAEACDFALLDRKPVFPRVPEKGGMSAAGQLREKTFSRAPSRYGRVTGRVQRRIEFELDIICRLNFADYFLIVSDIVDHARKIGTPAAGRGSGASSIVAYCLGITGVDPLEYDISFERFLHEDRRDFPDLDVDFCWRLRDDVIDYVYRKFGDEHVAMIATYATLQPRLAFREVAKAFGLSNPVITRVAKRLRRGLPESNWNRLPVEPELLRRIFDISGRLEGFPHHLSVHCGGVVITPDPIRRHAPLHRAQKGVVITQYDKDGVEDIGLVKLDLLGNRSLSTIREAVELVERTTGTRLEPEKLPASDAATISMLQKGGTVGCNQIESPAMRHLLQMLRPEGISGIMKALAVVRPGAASLGMKEAYVRRERGLEKPLGCDPRLDRILGETHGIMVYEDDVLLVAMHIAGLDTGRADRFRRAVTKCRSDEERLRLSKEFLSCCERAGTDRSLAKDLWLQMAKFNHQSFCRGHAAGYALLAYAVAYLKAHYPAQFWTAALNNNASMYDKWVYIEEAKRAGIRVMLPCVNRSREEFSFEDSAVRTGFTRVAELSQRTIKSILEARGRREFEGVVDFMARTRAQVREAENLIRCGAFDFTGVSRPAMLWQLYTLKRNGSAKGDGELVSLPMCVLSAAPPELDDYDETQKFKDEWEIVGLSARRHPLVYFGNGFNRKGLIRSSDISSYIGEMVHIAGVLAATRVTRTGNGGLMEFLTLDDGHGVFEVTVFPEAYRRLRRRIGGLGPYLVTGRIEDQYDALTICAFDIATV